MEILTAVVGYSAAVVGTLFMMPQVLKAWRSKSVEDLSLASAALYFLNGILWLAYGLLISAWPVVVANAIAFLISVVQLTLKLRYTNRS